MPIEKQISERLGASLQELITAMQEQDFGLYQETKDTAQLNPSARMRSINGVWQRVCGSLDNPRNALDLGSGFGYGTVFLHMTGIPTIGVEKVRLKNDQALTMFSKLGIPLSRTDRIDFSKSPAILQADILEIPSTITTDLITLFYASGDMISATVLQKLRSMLSANGKILISAQLDTAQIATMQSQLESSVLLGLKTTLIPIPDNFEQTAVILESDKRGK